MILGVCDWVAKKQGLNVKHVRIAFVLGILFMGAGITIYLLLWIVKILSK